MNYPNTDSCVAKSVNSAHKRVTTYLPRKFVLAKTILKGPAKQTCPKGHEGH